MASIPPLPASAIIPLYATAELRALEQAALATVPPGTLMERAGRAAADLALRLLGSVDRKRILVLAGPGNNGGDALVAARLLAAMQARVSVLPLFDEHAVLPPDAQRALQLCRGAAVQFVGADAITGAGGWALVIDGIFGIGLRRALDDSVKAVVHAVNALGCPVLALDVPSGLDAETGSIVGEHGAAIVADHTITFLADKPGLHTAHGRDHAGAVSVADLDVDAALRPPCRLHLCGLDAFSRFLRPRRHSAHKGSHGDVAVAGGAPGMSGAAILAARAAAYCGAGRVFVALLDRAAPYDGAHPELMLRDASGFDTGSAVLVVGPGLGQTAGSESLLLKALQAPRAIVLDADALNLLAARPELQRQVAQRSAETLITPHPLEAARLLGTSVAQVQATRVQSARELAARYGCVALLKGSGTVVAAGNGRAMINPTGNAGLATAGSGDVLAGICGSLLAQGYPAWEAALAAAWLHGAAADELVADGCGPIGLTAGELIPRVRALLNRLTPA